MYIDLLTAKYETISNFLKENTNDKLE